MATTFTLNYSGQEINNKLAQVETLATESLSKTDAANTYLAKTANDVTYSQSQYQFSINGPTENWGNFTFNVNSEDFTVATGDGNILTINVDFVERDYNGNITHLDWTNIATKTDAAQTYLAKNVSNWNYGQATNGFELGRSFNDPDLGPVDEYMELEMRSTDDIDATGVGLTQLPTLQLSTTLLNNPNYSDEYDISAYINALGIKTIRGEDGSETINYIPFKNIVNSTNLKTINNVSLIGTGNIEVAADVESITNAEIEALFADGYSGNITTFLNMFSALATAIKFDSAPTSNSDYDASVIAGTFDGLTSYEGKKKIYVWSPNGTNSGVTINGTSYTGGQSYSTAVEIQLTGNYDIALWFNNSSGSND